MGPGGEEVRPIARHRPHDKMPLHREPRVGLALHQIEEPLRQRACGSHLPLGHMKLRQSPEYSNELRRLPHLLAQGIGPGVDVAYVRGSHPLRCPQQLPQGELQREFVPGALGALGQGGQQREAFAQGGGRFVMGIPPGGVVGRLLRIADGLSGASPRSKWTASGTCSVGPARGLKPAPVRGVNHSQGACGWCSPGGHATMPLQSLG